MKNKIILLLVAALGCAHIFAAYRGGARAGAGRAAASRGAGAYRGGAVKRGGAAYRSGVATSRPAAAYNAHRQSAARASAYRPPQTMAQTLAAKNLSQNQYGNYPGRYRNRGGVGVYGYAVPVAVPVGVGYANAGYIGTGYADLGASNEMYYPEQDPNAYPMGEIGPLTDYEGIGIQ